MLQTLLTDRFGLAIHRDQKPASAYALLVANKEQLKPIDPPKSDSVSCEHQPGGAPGHMHMVCRATMEKFASILPGLSPSSVDLPVVDKTGLSGFFEFNLDWSISAAHARVQGYESDNTPPSAGSHGGATELAIVDALQSQVGLKLERQKVLLPVIVLDRVEKPTEN